MDLREKLEAIIHYAVAMNRRRLLCQASDSSCARALCNTPDRLWLPEERDEGQSEPAPTSTHHEG